MQASKKAKEAALAAASAIEDHGQMLEGILPLADDKAYAMGVQMSSPAIDLSPPTIAPTPTPLVEKPGTTTGWKPATNCGLAALTLGRETPAQIKKPWRNLVRPPLPAHKAPDERTHFLTCIGSRLFAVSRTPSPLLGKTMKGYLTNLKELNDPEVVFELAVQAEMKGEPFFEHVHCINALYVVRDYWGLGRKDKEAKRTSYEVHGILNEITAVLETAP